MICEICKRRDALVHLNITCKGETIQELYVCPICAKRYVEYDKKFKRIFKQIEEELEKDNATIDGENELLNRANKWKVKGVKDK